MKIAWVGGFEMHPNAIQIQGIKQAMTDLHHEALYLDNSAMAEDVFMDRLIDFHPDVIVALWYQFFLMNPVMFARQKLAHHIVFWFVDFIGQGDRPSEIDLVFLSNREQLSDYAFRWGIPESRVQYLPDGTLGFGTLRRIPHYDQPERDVLFIGNPCPKTYARRTTIIENLKSAGVNVEVIYHASKKDFNTMWTSQPSMYRQAKINLSISLRNDVDGYTSSRLLDICACGGFALAEWFPGCEDLFVPNQEVVYFMDEADLLEKVHYYLAHPQERAKIAQAGFYRVQKSHTMTHRLQTILAALPVLV